MLPNLLATPRGRMAAFFSLYVTEGIPQGFAAVAIATQMRRQGIEPAQIGAFIGAFYLPWALKWIWGPFVDVVRSRRFGHRRAWIIAMQLLMVATLLPLAAVPLATGLPFITTILLVHSVFGAAHDVAIDALAVNTLAEGDRGLANGLMLAGAVLGHAVGGAGVLFVLSKGVPLQVATVLVAAAILCVTTLVVLPMKEPAAAPRERAPGASRWQAVHGDIRTFAARSFRSFMGTGGAVRSVFFALLPVGAMSLGTPLLSGLAAEVGMQDDELGAMRVAFSVAAAAGLVTGGWLADRLGRRRMLAVYVLGLSLPVLFLAWALQSQGYVMPRTPGGPALADLQRAIWIASVTYALFGGMATGTRLAVMMDVTDPRVAATQFTAYTAMINFMLVFGITWQGLVVQAWGYPVTLLVDALIGLPALLLLPTLRRGDGEPDGQAGRRTRRAALVLGIACLAWLAFWPMKDALAGVLAGAQPVVNSIFTLVFVGSALFLLASREVLRGAAPWWRVAAPWVALLLFAMHGRYWMGGLGNLAPLQAIAQLLLYAAPLAGALVLFALAASRWTLSADPAADRR